MSTYDDLIEEKIHNMYINASSSCLSDYVASAYKKDLFFLRHKIDRLLKKCPDFGDLEEEWEKEIIFNILKEE
jgi:hypothetical protein